MLWDSLYLLSVVTLLTDAMLNGYLPWWLGAILLMVAVLFRVVARASRGVSDRTYRLFKMAFYGKN